MHKVYTAVKGCVAVVLVGVSVALFAGLQASLSNYVMGCIVAIGATFLCFDTWGMNLELNRLHTENDRFTLNNNDLRNVNEHLQTTHDLLENDVVKLNDELETLHEQNDVLSANVTTLTNNIKEYTTQNGLLREQIGLVNKVKTELEANIDQFRQQVDSMRIENGSLQKTADQQKSQIESLRIVQAQAKQLIASLMTAGDNFKDFQSTLIADIDHIDSTSSAMSTLLNKLTGNAFAAIDSDHDGSITREELESWSLKG